ncbi:MAG: RNA-binding S4 domain-containing protein [Ruminococcaceae bacterium]|nr:RNA-binding S4 domain-containing protein [Oscillospiraceae bacterium]
MRLDKYLKVSRIIKRRTVANDACDAEHVTVNGKRAKASYDVKVGDVVEITFGQRTLKFKVVSVRDNVAKAEASEMYEIIEE